MIPRRTCGRCAHITDKQKTARESGEARVEKRRSREEAEWYSRPAFR